MIKRKFNWITEYFVNWSDLETVSPARCAYSKRYITTIAYDEIPINRGKQILEDHYLKIWNEIYVKSESASHTKLYIPTIFHRLSFTLWPSFLLTQFLTNHSSFRSYLYKMNKTVQTARHLLLECSLWSKDRPTVLKSLPPPLVLQFHITTVSITNFLRRIFQALQEDAQGQ